jgi:hypothetical protein
MTMRRHLYHDWLLFASRHAHHEPKVLLVFP